MISRSLAGGALGLPVLISGCSPTTALPPGRPTGVATGTSTRLTLPTYVPFQGPQAELPGDARGLDPAFVKFPRGLVQSVSAPPGDGSTVTALTELTVALAPPMERNIAWQALNKTLNVTLDMQQVGATDYPAKVNVEIAGSDLPDFIYNPTAGTPEGVISALGQFLRSRCTDLTPYLSGDAINVYPNLAHFTTYTWRSAVYDGRIYAIPVAQAPIGQSILYRADLFEKAGVQFQNAPRDADDFKRILQALTRPRDNQFGIASVNMSTPLRPGSALLAIFRVPNNWRLDPSGKLIKDIESDEYKAAVGFARDLWQLGLWHPNTPNYGQIYLDDFVSGRFAVMAVVWAGFSYLWDHAAALNPSARIYPMYPFAFDGGKPAHLADPGNFGLTYITRQTSPERVKMLLRVANFLAAPFGTTEWLLNNFGVKDVDHTFNGDGAPVRTDQGESELTVPWRFITASRYGLFSANRSKQFATAAHAAEQAMLAAIQPDPTLGLYSPTAASSQGRAARKPFYDGVADIVLGRRPISDLGLLIADWRTAGGDKMRAEFEDALQRA